MRRHIAAHKDEIERLLSLGYVMVYVAGWYWLISGTEQPVRANCGSAKAVLRSGKCLELPQIKGWQRRTQPDYVKEK